MCRWSHKNTLFSVKYSFFSPTKITGFFHNIFCHNTMKIFQVFNTIRIYSSNFFIGIICIFDFLYFFLLTKNYLSINYIPHLT